jgi:MFS family permease
VAACYKWWVVFMLWFVCFFNYADRQAIFAVFPTLKKEFGFDTVELGLIGSAFMWVYAFGAPAGGIISDRLRRKELILGGCLFWSFVTVTTGWCSRLWHFIAVRALEGFGETIRILFRSPVVPLLMLAFVGANFVATIFLTWTPTFLVEKFGFRLAAAGLSGTVFIHLASAASVPVAGALADRLTRRFAGGRMLVQGLGLLAGAAFVVMVGRTGDRGTLILAMTAFGLCKGFYDSGIFASLFDAVEPRARGTAAGMMNTVGWGGGALGPVFVGWASKYGSRPTEVENMSDAIAFGGAVYLVSAAMIAAAMWLHARQARRPSS